MHENEENWTEGGGLSKILQCRSATVNTIVGVQLPQFVLIRLCVVVFKALLITRFDHGIWCKARVDFSLFTPFMPTDSSLSAAPAPLVARQKKSLFTLGPAYNKFVYSQYPVTASRFLCIKLIDGNIKKFGYNEHPLTTSQLVPSANEVAER